MDLGNKNSPAVKPDESRPEVGSDAANFGSAWKDLFRRDLRCWLDAAIKNWVILVSAPLILGMGLALFRMVTTSRVYVARCGLVRQEIADVRSMPAGYANVQRNVIYSLARQRNVLLAAAERVKLPLSYEQMLASTKVDQPERNSNYFYIQVTTKDGKVSAKIANALAEVLIETYKKLVHANMESACEGRIRSYNLLNEELNTINKEIEDIYRTNDIGSIEQEIISNNQLILTLEDRAAETQMKIQAIKTEIVDRARVELRELEQRYTDKNPRVQAQRLLLKQLEKDFDGAELLAGGDDEAGAENLSRLDSSMRQYNEQLNNLRKKRDLLAKVRLELKNLEAKQAQKNAMLAKLDGQIKEIQMYLDNSISDVTIQELAQPPPRGESRRVPLFGLIGCFLGALGAGVWVFGRELLNLTVRSRFDVETSLHLPILGVVPQLTRDYRADFYAALQEMVFNSDSVLAKRRHQKPIFIAVTPSWESDINNEVMSEILEILTVRKGLDYCRIRVPDSKKEAQTAPFLVNDYLYAVSETPPKPNKQHELYFKLDDLAFISPPTTHNFERLRQGYGDCDVVFMELFDFELHRQLFAEIAKFADLAIVPMRCGVTGKIGVYSMLRQLAALQVAQPYGVLYNVPIKQYRGVIL